jgi:RNA polymerase sigma-70 factor, ECF subfamily
MANRVDGAEYPIEPEDFERIVPQYQKQIFRILLCRVRNDDAANTLTQECFLRAYEKRSSFRGESSLSTWLIRIAINLAKDHNRNQRWAFWRKLSRTDRMDKISAACAGPSPEKAFQDRETIGAILSKVESLSERQKTIFLLHFVEDMSLDVIAVAMDLKLGTVKGHLARALASVRESFAVFRSAGVQPVSGRDAAVIPKEEVF